MEVYTPYIVYTNIAKMFGYRNIKIRDALLSEDQVAQKLNHYEFITIVGNRGLDPRGEAECYAILINPDSKYSSKSHDFKKLLKGLPKKAAGLEVMFISERVFTVHIKKQLAAFKASNPNLYIEDYDYEKFMIEIPKHVSVSRHEIATEDEVAKHCDRHFTSKEKFPKILVSDSMSVWIGAKPGMVVKITRISENSGTAIVYKHCIK